VLRLWFGDSSDDRSSSTAGDDVNVNDNDEHDHIDKYVNDHNTSAHRTHDKYRNIGSRSTH
jgi:hypothetical protein